jgi:hypothetical protein
MCCHKLTDRLSPGTVRAQPARAPVHLRRVVEVKRDFFIRWGLSSYSFFDSNSHESQKSTPNYIDNYAANETCGK